LRAHAKERGWEIHDWGIAESQMKKPRYNTGRTPYTPNPKPLTPKHQTLNSKP